MAHEIQIRKIKNFLAPKHRSKERASFIEFCLTKSSKRKKLSGKALNRWIENNIPSERVKSIYE